MPHFLIYLIPFLSLFLNRFRGGWLPTGHTQVARAIWAIGMAILTFIAILEPSQNWMIAAGVAGASAPLWMIFEMISPIGQWMGVTSVFQFFYGTACGVLNSVGVAPLLWWFGFPWYFVVGTCVLKGVCYVAGKYTPSKIVNFRQGPEASECIFGFVQGLGVALLSIH